MITEKQVFEWLQDHPLASIATLTTEGQPTMAAVYTYIDEKFNCYFVTKVVTRKSFNLSENEKIGVLWCDEENLSVCEMNGKAHELLVKEEVARVITRLLEITSYIRSAYWVPPVAQLKGSQYIVYRVDPEEINFTNYLVVQGSDQEPDKLSFNP